MKDPEVKIEYEDIIEFQFTNSVVYYNRTDGLWYANYYLDGDEITQIILDRDSIPEGLDITPEEFDILTEALKEILSGKILE